MFKILFLAFLLVPLLELYVLIKVGSGIGAGWTIFLVLATAILGAWLVKLQGLSTMQRAQQAMQRGEEPAVEVLEGAVLFFSGFLLLIPGFVTDIVGFLLLIPGLRRHLLASMIRNSQVIYTQRQSHYYSRHRDDKDIIDGEIVEDADDQHRLR